MKSKMYKVTLHMLKEEYVGYMRDCASRLSRLNNIRMAGILHIMPNQEVKEVIVYKSFGKFKEIITDVEIPGLVKFPVAFIGITNYKLTLEKPLFFRYSEHIDLSNERYPLLSNSTVNSKQLENYINNNLDIHSKNVDANYCDPKELYKKELIDLFQKAEDIYYDICEKYELGTNDKKQMKKIMKKYNLK